MVHDLSNRAHEVISTHGVPAGERHDSLAQRRLRLPMPAGGFGSGMSAGRFLALIVVPDNVPLTTAIGIAEQAGMMANITTYAEKLIRIINRL
jgi:hypothetical protein